VKILATYNIKGGVGKTAAAVNLAHRAAAEGHRVLVWDLDPQGAATFYFRVKPKVKGGGEALVAGTRELDRAVKGTDYDNLDLVPADFSYRNLDLLLDDAKKPLTRLGKLLAPMKSDYDIVVLDCPPSISLASEAVFRASDALLVPVIPTTLSARTFDQLDRFVTDHPEVVKKLKVLGFFSMVDARKRLHREMVADLRLQRPGMLDAQIPAVTDVERMGVHRGPVASFAPTSRAARAYRALWTEISDRL
jgi:chromosome partitioning protein